MLSLNQTSKQHLYLSYFYKQFNQKKFFNMDKKFDRILEEFIIFEDGHSELFEALKPYLSLKIKGKKPFIDNLFCEIFIDRIKNLDNFIPFYVAVVKDRHLRKKVAYNSLSTMILHINNLNNKSLFNKLIDLFLLNKKYYFLLQAIKEISVTYKFKQNNNMDYFLNYEQISHLYEYYFNLLRAKESIAEAETKFMEDLQNLFFDQFGCGFGNLKTAYIERALNFHLDFNSSLELLKSESRKDKKAGFKRIRKQLKDLHKDNFFLDKFYIKTLYRFFISNLKENNLDKYYQKMYQEQADKLRKSFSQCVSKLENCSLEKQSKIEKYYYKKWENFSYIFYFTYSFELWLVNKQINYFFEADTLNRIMLLKDLLVLTKDEKNDLLRNVFDWSYRLLVEKYLALSKEERQKYDLTQFKEIYKEVKNKILIIE